MKTLPTVPSGFLHSDPNDIERLQQTDELRPTTVARSPAGTPFGTQTCAWSSDRTYFAWPTGGHGGTVKLVPWDNRENKVVKSDNDDDNQNRVTIHSTKNIYNINEHRPTRYLEGKERVWSVAFGSGSTRKDFSITWKHFKVDNSLLLATGHQNGNVKVWNCNTGKLLLLLKDHKDIVKSLDFALDGSLNLLSGSRDGTLKLWNLNDDGNMYRTLRANTKWVYDAKWSPKCNFIASVGSDKSVILWNIEEDFKILRLQGHYNDVVGCCFSPDGALLATASLDTRVILWDVYTGFPVQELGHMFPPPRPIFAAGANDYYVRGISFHPHGQMIATINDDGFVRCWDLEEDGDPIRIAEHHNTMFVAFSPAGHRLSVGDREGGVKFYQTPGKVARLQHLCRMTIRANVTTKQVDFLILPFRLKEYLKYHEFLNHG